MSVDEVSSTPTALIPSGWRHYGHWLYRRWLALVTVLLLACLQLPANDAVPSVLILNSYHPGYQWSDDIRRGIEEVLHEHGSPIHIEIEYLDSKRHPEVIGDPVLTAYLRTKYQRSRFQVVISCDDNATWFTLGVRDALFPGTPQVFCGVNDLQRERLAETANITGINESADIGETIDCMLRLHPETSRLIVVTDTTETGKGVVREVGRWRDLNRGRVSLDVVDDVSQSRLGEILDQAKPGALVLYSFFFRDQDGRSFDIAESARFVVQHAKVPIYSTWDFNRGFGMVGGKQASGVSQGRAAGGMARRILDGTAAADIGIEMRSPNLWVFEYPSLRRLGIPVSALPPGSLIVGEPDNVFYRYRHLIWSVSALLCLLVAIIVTLAWNISRRRRAEAALRESEESLATTLDSIGDGVIATDAAGLVSRMNPVAEALTGWPLREAVGRPIADIFKVLHESDRSPIDSPVIRILRGESVASRGGHCLLLSRDGKELSVGDSAAPIRSRHGEMVGVVLVFNDQTAAKVAAQKLHDSEQRLRQHEKLGAIGQLAGGVAHDFNNQLTGILGFAELLSKRLSDPSHLRSTSYIIKSALRAADLTKQLLSFARKAKYSTAKVQIHDVVHEVSALLAHSIDKRIEIRLQLHASPDSVLGDFSQLQNALLNLAINARDAMPRGGILTFTTAIETRTGGTVDPDAPPESHVVIGVSDTGIGMDSATQRHLFEPFYTTKAPGKGTGLGLAAVYDVVQSHAGRIDVHSEPGHGSTFTIRLPLHRSGSSAAAPACSPTPTGTAHILVVDDEEMVRTLLADTLEDHGYRASMCSDGEAAMAFLRKSESSVDLVILDMVMPGCSGAETFSRLQASYPRIRVLISSGYNLNGEAQSLLDQGARGFIQKPFRATDLVALVATTLKQ